MGKIGSVAQQAGNNVAQDGGILGNRISPNLRKGLHAAGGGLQGMSNAMQTPQTPSYGAPIGIPDQPMVDPSYFQPNQLGYAKGPKPNSMFFGGGGY